MNSLKRLEYCSGFTVEISAPACNTQRPIQIQLLSLIRRLYLGGAWVFGSLWISTRADYEPSGHFKKWRPCLGIALASSSDS